MEISLETQTILKLKELAVGALGDAEGCLDLPGSKDWGTQLQQVSDKEFLSSWQENDSLRLAFSVFVRFIRSLVYDPDQHSSWRLDDNDLLSFKDVELFEYMECIAYVFGLDTDRVLRWRKRHQTRNSTQEWPEISDDESDDNLDDEGPDSVAYSDDSDDIYDDPYNDYYDNI
ncbi:hypothetical protein FE257_002305 [Aspergillus nanangensis]|uniref:Uncharacterized protein n=1 Tax=Aspergillus nanangensis TaxID=2582783 RepID=A0AAD4CCS7_ASPNN|nr:hypothetical protein FE257_002305 [Aspergillus nanangensis]